jgi:hypothetical protein
VQCGVLRAGIDVVEPRVARRVSLDRLHLGVLEREHLLTGFAEENAHLAGSRLLEDAAEAPLGLGGHSHTIVAVQLHERNLPNG